MAEFPQLLEEDFQCFNEAMNDFLAKSEATLALIVEKAGYLIQQVGNADGIDTTTLATLASNAYNATEFMAGIINEPGFSGMYEQGEKVSTLILKIDENALLVAIFPATLSVGAVKHYATGTVQQIASQLVTAQQRNPDVKIDLTDMDATDVQGVFRKKSAEPEPVVCQKAPLVQKVEPGEYYWCACGRSQSQPFCDGSHKGTGIEPTRVEIKEGGTVAWCMCKHTAGKPFCDGTHSKL